MNMRYLRYLLVIGLAVLLSGTAWGKPLRKLYAKEGAKIEKQKVVKPSPKFEEKRPVPSEKQVPRKREETQKGKEEFVPQQIIVKFKSRIIIIPRGKKEASVNEVTINSEFVRALSKKFGVKKFEKVFPTATEKKAPNLCHIYKLILSKDVDLLSVVKEYQSDPGVIYAEPNYLYYTSLIPDDPYYPDQWAATKIEAERAWDINTGSSSVSIAIIDSGVDYRHPDLHNIWYNTGEIPSNGIDDDGNGFVDDVKGWDFVDIDSLDYIGVTFYDSEDYEVRDNDPMDFNGHGTHCSGIAAAVTSNHQGIAGVAGGWYDSGDGCQIMCVRAGFSIRYGGIDYGVLELDDIVAAIYYAADNGADIISMSWGGGSSETKRLALEYAYSEGCVLVAAAGNSNSDGRYYPAVYDNVMAVAATDRDDVKCSFSNYGNWISVSAPGTDIWSTYYDYSAPTYPFNARHTYRSLSGTSMACPHVAGLAALILSEHPEFSKDQVYAQIEGTADNIDGFNPGYEGKLGAGRINAYRALTEPTVVLNGPDIIHTPQAAGEVEFQLIFSTSMDTSIEPVVSYDPAGLTTSQSCSGSAWSSTYRANDTYTVYNDYPIDEDTGDGIATITISDARSMGGMTVRDVRGHRFLIHIGDHLTIHVDNDNDSGIEDGSELYPFDTIEEALEVALSVDTIYVHPGTYTPHGSGYWNTIYMKEGVDLIGAGPDTTIIERSAVYGASNTMFSGFTLKHGSVEAYTVENFVISYNLFLYANSYWDTEIYIDEAEVEIINNSILYNHGTGIRIGRTNGNVRIKNNIIASIGCGVADYDMGDEDEPAIASYNNCYDIDGYDYWGGVEIGPGNISLDPLFVDPDYHHPNFHLQAGSPCIGTGEGGVDMGAFPFGSLPAMIYVDAGNDSGIEYGSSAYPYDTIREGLEVAGSGRTVIVLPGHYHVDSEHPYMPCLTMNHNVSLLGSGPSRTVIEGNGWDPIIETEGDARISGFTITNGGIGIVSDGGSLDISRNVFLDIRSHTWSGAAVEIQSGEASVINNTIVGCTLGLYAEESGVIRAINNIVVECESWAFRQWGGGELLSCYNDAWGNEIGNYFGGCAPGPGDISEDPLLRPNYHLSVFCSSPASMPGDIDYEISSPGLDAGTADIDGDGDDDIDYELRAPDMGAFEYKLPDWENLMKIK